MSYSKNHALARLRGRFCSVTRRMCRNLLRREFIPRRSRATISTTATDYYPYFRITAYGGAYITESEPADYFSVPLAILTN